MLAAGMAGTLRFRGWLQEALLEVEICWSTSQKMYLRAAVRPGCHVGGDGAPSSLPRSALHVLFAGMARYLGAFGGWEVHCGCDSGDQYTLEQDSGGVFQ